MTQSSGDAQPPSQLSSVSMTLLSIDGRLDTLIEQIGRLTEGLTDIRLAIQAQAEIARGQAETARQQAETTARLVGIVERLLGGDRHN